MRKDSKETQQASAKKIPADEDPNALYRYASPPCFMHEFAAWEADPMSLVEIRGLLNELLAGERAGARGVGEMCRETVSPDLHVLLHGVAKDEARFCAMLARQIERLGGTPNRATDPFYEKLRNLEAPAERLSLLNRGQSWVVSRLRQALPRIGDDEVHRELQEMLEVHLASIERCEAFVR